MADGAIVSRDCAWTQGFPPRSGVDALISIGHPCKNSMSFGESCIPPLAAFLRWHSESSLPRSLSSFLRGGRVRVHQEPRLVAVDLTTSERGAGVCMVPGPLFSLDGTDADVRFTRRDGLEARHDIV